MLNAGRLRFRVVAGLQGLLAKAKRENKLRLKHLSIAFTNERGLATPTAKKRTYMPIT